ncbi:Undecaprenyl-diphosphatase [Dissostichus eleginoides]|uniref:Undecaprenyl-diphosphatase n=1 Tax=Dissostichus eleginoides TaxID=100907 RepID=A0AAD9B6M2_DISEL|nr:Undecaprenyl-diphosphatase [Dissostichus eleginoides]
MSRDSRVDGPPVAGHQSQVVSVSYGIIVVIAVVLVPVVFLRERLQMFVHMLVRLLVSCETVKITWCIR